MRVRHLAFMLCAFAGCASGRVVLQKPIADQCHASGLKGCPELTEGVLLYVEGNQQEAFHKLHLAVNANEPEEVLAFADGLKTVSQIPGAGQITAPIQQVINILATEARRASDAPAARSRKSAAGTKSTGRRRSDDEEPDPSERAEPVAARTTAEQALPVKAATSVVMGPAAWSVRPMDLEGSTVVPALDETNRACALVGMMSPSGESTRGYCVRVGKGPLVITDLHSTSGCPAELFALAVALPGELSAPRWAVYGGPLHPINVTGGSLAVRETEYLVIGTMSTADQKIKRDVRCSITWSGWRPAANVEPTGQASAIRR
jgi:hypothetical protein